MRTLIVSTIASLDGFVEGPEGHPLGLPMDAAFDAYNAERLETADTLLLGRKTYDMFRSFWPAVQAAPDATPDQRRISERDDAIAKLVVSDSPAGDDVTAPWTSTTEVVDRASAAERVRTLKEEPGGEILVFGSRTLWNQLLRDGLVDELHLMVGAVTLGGGVPLFADGAPALDLVDARSFAGSSNVVLRYRVGR